MAGIYGALESPVLIKTSHPRASAGGSCDLLLSFGWEADHDVDHKSATYRGARINIKSSTASMVIVSGIFCPLPVQVRSSAQPEVDSTNLTLDVGPTSESFAHSFLEHQQPHRLFALVMPLPSWLPHQGTWVASSFDNTTVAVGLNWMPPGQCG